MGKIEDMSIQVLETHPEGCPEVKWQCRKHCEHIFNTDPTIKENLITVDGNLIPQCPKCKQAFTPARQVLVTELMRRTAFIKSLRSFIERMYCRHPDVDTKHDAENMDLLVTLDMNDGNYIPKRNTIEILCRELNLRSHTDEGNDYIIYGEFSEIQEYN